jgi:hypothetical protein
MIDRPSSIKSSLPLAVIQSLRFKAIEAYGHFAVEDGQLVESSQKLYEKWLKTSQSPKNKEELLIYVLQSLKNTATPQSVEIILALFQDQATSLKMNDDTRFYALGMLGSIFKSTHPDQELAQSEQARQTDAEPHGAPHFGIPLSERKNPEHWRKLSERTRQVAQAILDQKQSLPHVLAEARNLQATIKQFAEPSVQTSIHTSATKSTGSPSTEPNPSQRGSEGSKASDSASAEKSSVPLTIWLVLGVLGLGILIFFKFKK